MQGLVVPNPTQMAESHAERNGDCTIVTCDRQDGMELARCSEHERVWYTRLAMDKIGLDAIHGQWPE